MCLHVRNGQWGNDFWEHSAVVRELTTHVLHPKHPQLLIDAPHAFYSPYAVIVALLGRVLHRDAVATLSIAGLLNLGLLFLGIKLFVSSMVSKQYRDATAFYTLLLTLFWWGSDPWFWSGFFHIRALGYVLPYPSTFAGALTLIACGLNGIRIGTKRQLWVIPIFFISVTVLISHPTTFLFLSVGLISQSFTDRGPVLSQSLLVGGLLGLSLLAVAFWPYFPVWSLLSDVSTHMRDMDSKVMYQQVVSRIWPSLLAVPLIIINIKSGWRRPVVLMVLVLSGIYAFGAISGKYSYGRVISYIVLLFHVVISEYLSKLESKIYKSYPPSFRQRLIAPAGVMVLALLLSFMPFLRVFGHAVLGQQSSYNSYLFLSKFTKQYDVVLSDIETSWVVPTFGGKVVASLHPLSFVPDHDVRRADLDRFFSGETAFFERQQIVQKYRANYLLLSKSAVAPWNELKRSFMTQGQVMFESDDFVLISLNRDYLSYGAASFPKVAAAAL